MTDFPHIRIVHPKTEAGKLPEPVGAKVYMDGKELTAVKSYEVREGVGEAQTVTLTMFAHVHIEDAE